MDRGAWRAAVQEVAKSQTRLKRLSTHTRGWDTAQVASFLPQMQSLICKTKPWLSRLFFPWTLHWHSLLFLSLVSSYSAKRSWNSNYGIDSVCLPEGTVWFIDSVCLPERTVWFIPVWLDFSSQVSSSEGWGHFLKIGCGGWRARPWRSSGWDPTFQCTGHRLVPGQETKIRMCHKVQPKKIFIKKIFLKTKIGPEREEELFNALKQRLRFFLEVGKRSSHALLNVNEDAPWKDMKYRILNQNASWRWVLNQNRHCCHPQE